MNRDDATNATKGKETAADAEIAAKGCQWMRGAKGWQDCGEPACFRHPGSTLVFCAAHAEILKRGFILEEIAP